MYWTNFSSVVSSENHSFRPNNQTIRVHEGINTVNFNISDDNIALEDNETFLIILLVPVLDNNQTDFIELNSTEITIVNDDKGT